MDGFDVMPIKEASKIGDIFVTATGDISVISKECFPLMKDGAILCNSGHFNVEISIDDLKKMSKGRRMIQGFCRGVYPEKQQEDISPWRGKAY